MPRSSLKIDALSVSRAFIRLGGKNATGNPICIAVIMMSDKLMTKGKGLVLHDMIEGNALYIYK